MRNAMEVSIRPVDGDRDLPELAAMLDRVMTSGSTVAQLRSALVSPAPIHEQTVATSSDGKIVGWYELWRSENAPPGKAFTSIIVHPEYRRQGIGTALHDHVVSFAKSNGINELKSRVKDTEPRWLAWAESKGFKVERHGFRSSIKLSEFDEKHFSERVDAVETSGITLTTLAAIGDTDVNRRRYYDADSSAAIDIPGEDHVDTWEEYKAHRFDDEDYNPASAFLALHEERIVGVAHVTLDQEHDRFFNEFTGVVPDFRRRGIAQALKIKTILYAREVGVPEILTENDSENAPMLAVNRKLGYKPWPGAHGLLASI